MLAGPRKGAVKEDGTSALYIERTHAGVYRGSAQLFLNAEKLVVLCHAFGAAWRTCFYLAGVQCHGEVCDGGVFRFTGAKR